MKAVAENASGRGTPPRTVLGALTFALILGMAGCGRRGPPLAPIQVDPETPRVLPLRQENGRVLVRWYAPRLDDGGDAAELRLRRAIVSYRVVDILGLAAEERASQRQPPEEVDEEEPEETTSGDEDTIGTSEPEDPGTGTAEETAPEAEPGTVEAPTGEETPAQDPDPPGTAEPETEEPSPEGAPSGEALPEEPEPEPDQPPEAEPDQPPEAEPEQPPEAGPEQPPEAEPEQAPEAEPEQPPEAEPEQPPDTEPEQLPDTEPEQPPEAEPEQAPATAPDETGEEPDTGEPAAGETGGDDPVEAPEPEAEPEPAGVLLDYEDLEFEVLSEIESEVPGEERVLELPVEPDWIGRRLEITIRYEARRGASEESEIRSLDVTGPLPAVEGISVDVGPSALTVRWRDSRSALEGPLPLSDPVFEVFRRRGGEPERLGRSFGLQQADTEVVWGEEICYQARLVVAGSTEEGVIPDPGPVLPESAGADEGVGGAIAADGEEAPAATESGEEAPAPLEAGESGTSVLPVTESGDPQGESALPQEAPEPEEAAWDPIPIRVPGAGSGAVSVGPMSAEVCVTPVDVFPPLPPSDLRLFWQAQQTDLSWRESTSTDVVGYHVYRSGPDGTEFARLTPSPVEQTSFADTARDPRGAYRYAITAVDGADSPNESLPSDSRRVNPR